MATPQPTLPVNLSVQSAYTDPFSRLAAGSKAQATPLLPLSSVRPSSLTVNTDLSARTSSRSTGAGEYCLCLLVSMQCLMDIIEGEPMTPGSIRVAGTPSRSDRVRFAADPTSNNANTSFDGPVKSTTPVGSPVRGQHMNGGGVAVLSPFPAMHNTASTNASTLNTVTTATHSTPPRGATTVTPIRSSGHTRSPHTHDSNLLSPFLELPQDDMDYISTPSQSQSLSRSLTASFGMVEGANTLRSSVRSVAFDPEALFPGTYS